MRYKPYLMSDVHRIPLGKLKAISTFSGCGGSSLGYRLAGVKVCAASEFDKEAADTYEENFPDTPVSRDDIRKMKGSDLLDLAKVKSLDILDGSPPCASFSTAGRREEGWGKVRDYSGQKQRTDDLFWEFARILNEIQPRAFVAENVSGMTKGVAKGYFNEIIELLRSQGYQVGCRLVDASLLGVPQKRERIFFVGFRNDLNLQPVYPRPLPTPVVTVREALEGVSTTGDPVEFEKGYVSPMMAEYIPKIQCGKNGADVIEKEWSEKRKKEEQPVDWKQQQKQKRQEEELRRAWFNLMRLDWGRPSFTALAEQGRGPGGLLHPDFDRRLTIPELRRISSFPDDFKLTGPYDERWERIGRAVPPFMLRAIAAEIRRVLE